MATRQLPPNQIVFRLIVRAQDIDSVSGFCAAGLFIRREKPKDPKGLSVVYDCEASEVTATGLGGIRAVARLIAGDIPRDSP